MIKTNEDFIQAVYNLVQNEYVFLEDYINTKSKIKCRHNTCGYEWETKPNNFLNGRRCPECNKSNRRPSKTNERFIKEVYDLVGDEYVFLDEYTNSQIKIKCKHNICGFIYDVTPNNFLKGKRCPQCAGSMKKTTKKFKQEVYDLVCHEYTILGEYIKNSSKIKIKHNVCENIFKMTPAHFLRGQRCPQCNSPNRDKDTQQFKQEVFNLVGEEYTVLGEYINNSSKIKLKHHICGNDCDVTPQNFLRNRRCPRCMESKGEQTVRSYLQNNNINFIQESSFSELVSKMGNPLRFDFYLPSYNSCIEYDGEFHYIKKFEEQKFEEQQHNDNMKNEYCKNNNIQLLRIPYWEFDNIEEILNEWLRHLL